MAIPRNPWAWPRKKAAPKAPKVTSEPEGENVKMTEAEAKAQSDEAVKATEDQERVKKKAGRPKKKKADDE